MTVAGCRTRRASIAGVAPRRVTPAGATAGPAHTCSPAITAATVSRTPTDTRAQLLQSLCATNAPTAHQNSPLRDRAKIGARGLCSQR